MHTDSFITRTRIHETVDPKLRRRHTRKSGWTADTRDSGAHARATARPAQATKHCTGAAPRPLPPHCLRASTTSEEPAPPSRLRPCVSLLAGTTPVDPANAVPLRPCLRSNPGLS
eukprot:3509389-Prymnesium_polylepis.1